MYLVDSVNFEDNDGEYPLRAAVQSESLEIVSLLIDNYAIVNWINKYDDTVLASIYNVDILDFLIKHGLDIHHREYNEYSPLEHICYRGLFDMAKRLIELGVEYQHLDLSNLSASNGTEENIKEFQQFLDTFEEKERLETIAQKEDNSQVQKFKI